MRISLLLSLLLFSLPNLQAADLELKKGDHICLVGNALGERMQHQNYFETLLHQKYPQLELTVRNLCFPGDEPYERIRSENFGDPNSHLRHSKASVVVYFFGFNESFAGKKGAKKFQANLVKLANETKATDYGSGTPQVVLVSPIAFENTGNANLPTGEQQNTNLALYTKAMKQAADEAGVAFVDLFTPTQQLFQSSDQQLTSNGAHLNAKGYQALADIFLKQLFGQSELPPLNEELRELIAEKNFHWWHRYRAVNGYSIYGTRGKAGSDGTYNNTDVMERERAILDQMTTNRDQRIWDIAQGKDIAGPIDDSNTLPFINPKTNVGGEDDINAKRGKLGSLDYLSSAEQLKRFKLAPGFKIELVASEEQFPELANPVSLSFDNKGRLWVSTMQSYPQWKPKTKLNDKLLIFEDHNKDGKADECKVFAEGLHQPTGFELGHGGAYVAQQPDVLFLKDENGDDKADSSVRQLVGFCSADSHHGLAAFEWGPGGALYFQEGTFKFSQVESPYGLTRCGEAGVWRYDPRTEQFGVHANFAFSNPWGHSFDKWGQDFIADASPGFSFWAAPITGKIDYPQKHPGGSQHRRVAKMSGGDPQFRFKTFYPKRTRPSAGCTLVYSRQFPEEMQGNFLLTNCIGDRSILNHTISEEGSGFEGKEVPPLVFCEDGNFRPVDVEFGPDGALYIVDWHNALIGHLQHNLREPNRDHKHGRIWRLSYEKKPLLDPPAIDGEPIPALLDLLGTYEDRTRYWVRRELAARDSAEVMTELNQWIGQLDPNSEQTQHLLCEAMWVAQSHNQLSDELLERVLESGDHRARAAAVRELSFKLSSYKQSMDWLTKAIGDPHPRVRLEAVRALSFYAGTDQSDAALELALEVLNHDVDDYLQYTLDETLRVLE